MSVFSEIYVGMWTIPFILLFLLGGCGLATFILPCFFTGTRRVYRFVVSLSLLQYGQYPNKSSRSRCSLFTFCCSTLLPIRIRPHLLIALLPDVSSHVGQASLVHMLIGSSLHFVPSLVLHVTYKARTVMHDASPTPVALSYTLSCTLAMMHEARPGLPLAGISLVRCTLLPRWFYCRFEIVFDGYWRFPSPSFSWSFFV